MAPLMSEPVDMLSPPSSPDTTDMDTQNPNDAGNQSTGGKTRRRRTFKELSRNFVCEMCSRPYASLHALKQHKRLKHASSDDASNVATFNAGGPLGIRLSDSIALPYGSRARAHSVPVVPTHVNNAPPTPAHIVAQGSIQALSLESCSFLGSPSSYACTGGNCDSIYPCASFSSYDAHNSYHEQPSPITDVDEHFARALSARRTMSAPAIHTQYSPLQCTQYTPVLMSTMTTPDPMFDYCARSGDNMHCDVVLEEEWGEDISSLVSNLDSFMATVESVQAQELIDQLIFGSLDFGIPSQLLHT